MDRLKSRHKAALLLLLGDICAGAAPDAAMRDATVPTALPGTAAYTHVPAGFEPGQADDAALARLGFPPRPDRVRSPAAYRSWSQAVTGMQRIIPDLRKVPIQHGPMRHVFSIDNVATSSNWSGYVAAAPAYGFGRQSMVRVRGDWLLPIAQPPFGTCRLTHDGAAVYSSTWVGIDGDGSPDVLQAGTESDAVCSAGQIATYQGAWYEWYPDDEIRVSNLPVTPGSAMAVYVWANSATQGHAYLANRSAHVAVAVAFDAPGGTTLTGNSAEWIVERPYVNGAPASLTNYVQEFMGNAIAFDAAHGEYEPGAVAPPGGSPALRVQMTDAEGQVVSVPTLLGQNGIWFSDTGSALTTYR